MIKFTIRRLGARLCPCGLLLAIPFLPVLMGATNWTPAAPGAPALGVWFDAADGSSLTLDSSNNGQVTGWRDKSGNNRNATGPDPARLPSLGSLNGRATVEFGPFNFDANDAQRNYMTLPETSVQTVIMVWGSQYGGGFMLGDASAYDFHRGDSGGTNNPFSTRYGGTAADPIFSATYASSRLLSGDAETRLDGSVVDPTTTGLSGNYDIVVVRTATGSPVQFGTLTRDHLQRAGGQGLAELITLPGRASTGDIQRIEGYLAWKWGLQGKLPSGHPYKNNAPTVAGLQNGGFEAGALANNGFAYNPTDQGPWVFNGNAGDMTLESPISNGTLATPDGRIAAFVQSQGSIDQTFTLDAGDAGGYALSFLIARRQYLAAQTILVQVDGMSVFTVQVSPSDNGWHQAVTPAFMLTAGPHTLRFQGLAAEDGTAFIDAVALISGTILPPPQLIAELRFEDGAWNGTAGELADSSGLGHPGTAVGSPIPSSLSGPAARPGEPGTCSYAGFSGGAFDVSNLPVSTAAGDTTTVMFWMYWDGTDQSMPIGFHNHALLLIGGVFGFNTGNNDIYGIFSAGLANGWHHVAAVFVNGNVAAEQLYIDGASQSMSQRTGGWAPSSAYVESALRIGGWTRDGAFRYGGFLDEFRVYAGAAGPADVAAAIASAHSCGASYPPSAFNAYESATAGGATSGVIHTKVAGAPFSVDVVALKASPVAIRANFVGSVKVEIINANDNSGALDANGCRSSWTPLPSGAATSVNFVAGDSGRKTVTLSELEAWRDLRLRITTPAVGAPVTSACSSDDFANRPATFASFSVTDNDSTQVGTARSLSNGDANGGVVHRAGRPFTVKSMAVNAGGATTVNYAGTPLPSLTLCGGSACLASATGWAYGGNEGSYIPLSGTHLVRYGANGTWATQQITGGASCTNGIFGDPLPGIYKHCEVGNFGSISLSMSAVAGVVDQVGQYDDAGSFSLQLIDSAFASVDASDGSTDAERVVASSVLTVGRFVPDHFDITALAAPAFRTFGSNSCVARSFTYIGQPFGYAALPQARVIARNAGGAVTGGYAEALWKLQASSLSQSFTTASATAAIDASATLPPALTSNGDGSGLLVGTASDKLRFARPAGAPAAPFNAGITVTWSAIDASEASVAGNDNISTLTPLAFSNVAFDAGNQFRFGQLRMVPAYGSELIDLPVSIEAQYWDGQRMAANTADQCTTLPANSVTMSNYQRALAACKSAVGTNPLSLVGGRAFVKLSKPGHGNGGSVNLAVQLGTSATGQTCVTAGAGATAAASANLPWLQGRWGGAPAFDQNPSTRASFGQFRSPLIYQREVF